MRISLTMTTDRKAYEDKVKAQLRQKQAEIDGLKAKISERKADARIDLDKQMKELESKQADLEEKLGKMRDASGAAWDDLKTGVSSAWNDFTDSVDKARKQFSD